MKQFCIRLSSVEDVQEFVRLAMVKPFGVMVGDQRHSVNGKNFMGMFCLDLRQPQQVQVDCDETQFYAFRQEAARFLTT